MTHNREEGWGRGESTCLPPVWPRFKSQCGCHMWVEFLVGSLPYSERFFAGYSGSPSPQKPTFPNSNFVGHIWINGPPPSCTTTTKKTNPWFSCWFMATWIVWAVNRWEKLNWQSSAQTFIKLSLYKVLILFYRMFGNQMKNCSLLHLLKSFCLRSNIKHSTFHHQMKYIEVRQKYSAVHRIFNS